MRWTPLALSGYAGLAAAHGDHGIPHIVGDSQLASELRARGYAGHAPHMHGVPLGRRSVAELRGRQSANGRCGPNIGKCAVGSCCSSAGWCGTGKDYCAAPDCQIDYGPACDGNQVPKGTDTSGVVRTKAGNVPYGGLGIYSCVTKGEIAITYDDGPYQYTNDLLNLFKKYNAFATFFVTGNNLGKGQINDPTTPWPAILKRMMAKGHQIASHTWSHQNSSQLTAAQMKAQMVNNEIAIANVLGYFPTYMRPPYSICESQCQSILSTLGYHIVYFDLDTEGYLRDSVTQIQGSKDIWDAAVGPANPATTSFLHIEHDLQSQVVYNLTEHMLISLAVKGFKSVPVGQCLGDDPKNWYRSLDKPVPAYPPPGVTPGPPSSSVALPSVTGSSSSAAATTSSATDPVGTMKPSIEGNCGNGITCIGWSGGSCCSQYGWCGSDDNYCGAGCQSAFGTCANSPGAPSASSSATATAGNPQGTLKPSIEGNCGNGITCIGWPGGSCCSQYGWCGADDSYCGAGCQPAFGTCADGPAAPSPSPDAGTASSSSATSAAASASSSSSSSSVKPTSSTAKTSPPTPTSTALKPSTNGNCGKTAGMTCNGSKYAPCCSRNNKCDWNCFSGCQKAYGWCF